HCRQIHGRIAMTQIVPFVRGDAEGHDHQHILWGQLLEHLEALQPVHISSPPNTSATWLRYAFCDFTACSTFRTISASSRTTEYGIRNALRIGSVVAPIVAAHQGASPQSPR